MMFEAAGVQVTTVDTVGILTLNRPRSVNSLTHSMVRALHAVLTAWSYDPDITAVILQGAGDRGLCAGGDIVAIYHDIRNCGGVKTRQFWFDEYRLNAFIAAYPKPYIALMDGLVMGGGVGVSAHGSVRIVTEKSKVGMPEVSIGFIPDVGGTYLLSRAPGLSGLHTGLTGAALSGADAIALGFADHYVPHEKLPHFVAAVVDGGISVAVAAHAIEPPPSELARSQWITEGYDHDTVADIVAALRRHGADGAGDAANLIASRSPTALMVTLGAVRRAGSLATLEEVLMQEYRVSCAALRVASSRVVYESDLISGTGVS